jgi:hypothetical protein
LQIADAVSTVQADGVYQMIRAVAADVCVGRYRGSLKDQWGLEFTYKQSLLMEEK